MNLYGRLKPHHIQQDMRAGCSLASFLMVRNCILNDYLTQAGFREYLTGKKSRWVKMAGEFGSGVGCSLLHTFVVAELNNLKLSKRYQCLKIRARDMSFDSFAKTMEKISIGRISKDFIIFNFDAHYSPMGGCIGDSIKILDVDFSRKHNGEFKYEAGIGERDFSTLDFYNKLTKQRRSFLHIKNLSS